MAGCFGNADYIGGETPDADAIESNESSFESKEQSNDHFDVSGDTESPFPTTETRPLTEAAEVAKTITQPSDGNYTMSCTVTQKNSYDGTTEIHECNIEVKANGNNRYVKFKWSYSGAGWGTSLAQHELVEIWYVDSVAYVEESTWQVVNGKRMDYEEDSATLKNTDFDSVCSRYRVDPLDIQYLTSFSVSFLENGKSSAAWSNGVYEYQLTCDSQQKKNVASAFNKIRVVGSRMYTVHHTSIEKADVDCTIDTSGHLGIEVNIKSDVTTSCIYSFSSGSSSIALP